MSFSEWIRREGYLGLDFLTGSKVRKHYADIQYLLENETNSDVIKMKEDYLENILQYAIKNVEFYKDLKGFHSIESFPIINKNIIKNNYAAFQSPEFLKAEVFQMHTGGSTGTPFVVRQDKNKRNRVFAEMMYFWRRAGYHIGMRYIYFRIWTPLNRKSKLTSWTRNIIMSNILRLDEETLASIRNTLKSDHKIKMLLGYASTFENLANYLLAKGDTPDMFNIKTIISSAEFLPESTREKLKRIFKCTIVSMYSNQENGVLAQECNENKEFHLNSASYFIELLKIDSDEPASIGEPGRIVITDLFNHAMPMIRYDTGDIGEWKIESECGWKSRAFSSVHGRMLDFVFDTNGNRISPQTIIVIMWPYDKILQFQCVQTGAKKFVLKLNGAQKHYDNATFIELFKNLMGKDAEISVEHVNEIPVLESGKRKIVVNNVAKLIIFAAVVLKTIYCFNSIEGIG